LDCTVSGDSIAARFSFHLGELKLELIAIKESGELARSLASAPPIVPEIVEAMTTLYRAVGYQPPWIGYLAVEGGSCVGTCGFKSPPQNDRTEIAYFTFPGHESRGVATRMASELIRLARVEMPAVIVAAQTLPEESASTSVLKKLRFRLTGTVEHPEDGTVWEWRLSDKPAEVSARSV
jgi:RimJ/RimL family protein N-acetyltransferase